MKPTRGLIAVLSGLAALGALSTNIILPSFPSIGAELRMSQQQLGLTLSVFFVVFAVGQLFVGPLSDRFGRRPLVVSGLVLFLVGSVLCALASDATSLLVGRAVQAAGVCAASVLARAIARDLFEGEALARVLAMTIVAMAAAPGFSPLLGGLSEAFLGWRTTFAVVGMLGSALAIWYVVRLGETHSPDRRSPLALGPTLRAYADLVTDQRFIQPAMAVSLVIGSLYGLFSAAPAVLMGGIGLTALQLGFFFAGTVFIVFAAGLLVPRFAHRWGQRRTTLAGLLIALVGGLLVLWTGARAPHALFPFMLSISVFLFGMGTANPLGTAIALSPFGARAGMASAMLGFLQMAAAAVGSIVVTAYGAATMTSLGLVLSSMLAIAVVVFIPGKVPAPSAA